MQNKLLIGAMVLLVDCQAHQMAGDGPIDLSSRVESYLQVYLAHPAPGYFAVSIDGQNFGYSICNEGLCTESSGSVALRSCRDSSKGVPCKIYAMGDRIIWQNIDSSGEKVETVKVEIGSGPIKLLPSVETYFQKYLGYESPEYFAVAVDGTTAGYSYCKNAPCASSGLKELAVNSCLQRSQGVACHIYAIRHKVVWKNQVGKSRSESPTAINRWDFSSDADLCRAAVDSPAAGWTSNPSYQIAVQEAIRRGLTPQKCTGHPVIARGGAPTSSTKASTEWEQRSIAVQWTEFSELIAGDLFFRRDNQEGRIKLTLPNSAGECNGTYTMAHSRKGVWSFACANGLTVSGTLTSYGFGKGASGEGRDNKGGAVKFAVGGG